MAEAVENSLDDETNGKTKAKRSRKSGKRKAKAKKKEEAVKEEGGPFGEAGMPGAELLRQAAGSAVGRNSKKIAEVLLRRTLEGDMSSAKLLLTLAEKQPAVVVKCDHSVAINLAEDDPYEEPVEDFFGPQPERRPTDSEWWRAEDRARLDGMSPGARNSGSEEGERRRTLASYNKFMESSLTSSPVTIRCKGFLFDMDGILISSLGSVERSWTKWALLRGIDPKGAVSIAHGRRAIETIAVLCPDLNAEEELRVIEEIEVNDNEGLTVLPGVLKLLSALPKDRWTVVTSATERLARVRLAAGGIPVPERLVTAETVRLGKPDPAPYLAGAALLGLAAEDCVVFEDSPAGVKSGRAAGCTVVATTFSHSIQALEAAHYLIEGLTEVEVSVLGGDEGLALKLNPLAV